MPQQSLIIAGKIIQTDWDTIEIISDRLVKFNGKERPVYHANPGSSVEDGLKYKGRCGHCVFWSGSRRCYLRRENAGSGDYCQDQREPIDEE